MPMLFDLEIPRLTMYPKDMKISTTTEVRSLQWLLKSLSKHRRRPAAAVGDGAVDCVASLFRWDELTSVK